MDLALQANLDQLSAYARECFSLLDVNLEDPAQIRAIAATWRIIEANQHATPWVLAAIAQTLGYPPVQSPPYGG